MSYQTIYNPYTGQLQSIDLSQPDAQQQLVSYYQKGWGAATAQQAQQAQQEAIKKQEAPKVTQPVFDLKTYEEAIAGAAAEGKITAAIPAPTPETAKPAETAPTAPKVTQPVFDLKTYEEAIAGAAAEGKITAAIPAPTPETAKPAKVTEPVVLQPTPEIKPQPISAPIVPPSVTEDFTPEMTDAQIQQKEEQAIGNIEKKYTDEYEYSLTKDGVVVSVTLQEAKDNALANQMLGKYIDPKTGQIDVIAAARDLGENNVARYLKDIGIADAGQLATQATLLAATTVKLNTGENVPNEFYESLNQSQQTEINKVGFDKYMDKHYVILPDGSYIDKTTFDSWPTEMQTAVTAGGIAVLDRYDAATAEGKFAMGKELGLIPQGAFYAGGDKDGEPQYYEVTGKQISEVEKVFLEETAKFSPAYMSQLLNRAGITTPRYPTYDALVKQFNHLSDDDKTQVLSIYHWQSTQEEGRVVSTDPWEMGLVVIGDTGGMIHKAVTEASANLAPGLGPIAIGAASVVTTLGEMAAAFPVLIGYVISDPRRIADVAIGVKDFVYQAGLGALKGDPWAAGQMAAMLIPLWMRRGVIVSTVK